MTLREKVARAVAEAKTGLDPETRIVPFPPAQAKSGEFVIPTEDSIRPLWTNYIGAADAAIAVIRNVFADMMGDAAE